LIEYHVKNITGLSGSDAVRVGMAVRRTSVLLSLLLFLGVVLPAVLAGCTPANPQSTFDAQGPVARMQLRLFYIIFWAAVFVFVSVEGILLYTVIRFRRRPGQGVPPQFHGNTPLEIGWTLAPAVVLIVIAVPTVTTMFRLANPPSEDRIHVRVVAHQWWWEFQYPELGVVAANEMHIPAGRVVTLTLESEDVIHSFWVPKLAGKTDIIPTRKNTMWLQADAPGTYFGQCAEFCGIAHALMRLRVIAQPKEEFEVWVQVQRAAPEPPLGEAARGAQIFAAGACVACHTLAGTPAQGRVGPNLTHFASRQTLGAGLLDRSPENVAKWLKDPQAVKPGNKMPNLNLQDEEIRALVAYLESLK
jgi:cytochrome c oxidase subunit 2